MKKNVMSIKELEKIIWELFPNNVKLLEANGPINQVKKNVVKKIGLTLGYSHHSIKAALNENLDVLLIHNVPEARDLKLVYFKQIEKLADKNNLLLFKLHLPLDFAPNGIMDTLCKILLFHANPTEVFYLGHKLKNGIYLVDNQLLTLKEIVRRINNLKPKSIRIAGGRKNIYRRIAIVSGDGCKPEFLLQVKPDVFISGLLNQESIRIAEDLNITLIEATSYSTENEPLKLIARQLRKILPIDLVFIESKNSLRVV